MKNLFLAGTALANELSTKKFPPEKEDAYLSCFLSIRTINNFLRALDEEYNAQPRLHLTAATPRKTGAKSKEKVAVKSRRK